MEQFIKLVNVAHKEARAYGQEYKQIRISRIYTDKLLKNYYPPEKEVKMASKIVIERHIFNVLTRGKIKNPETTSVLVSGLKSETFSFNLLTVRNGWTSDQYHKIRLNVVDEKLVYQLGNSSRHGEFLG